MEDLVVSPCQKQTTHAIRRNSSHKDLWLVSREGSVSDLDLALSLLKKNGGNVNARNSFGLTPLHIATWRNHIPIVRRLLEAGADPNARDGESGWSSLHRALHFGHLAVACVLLQFGASFTLEDSKSRIPVDLLSGPVLQAVGSENNSIATEVFSWGSGVNYQLGTGNAHIQKLPCKVDSLHNSVIKLISAAKFHSVAVSSGGEVYTWGFGRGGRLGHPDFDIHSGQAAVITPRQVTSGLGARRVKAIAAAKHHTVVATEGGEVFTWGSNREGQLGYTSVDTQPTPRRVSSLKARIVAVAAANKHTVVVSEAGEIYTWGCNKEGQLGYGTSNSASNYTPRVVEYLKGKSFTRITAAKYHSIALGSDGEVFTWGHRLVTPRRVVIARSIRKVGNTVLKFHRKERLSVVAISAGVMHSVALIDDGALFYWKSSDPDLRCQQLLSLCGKSIVSVSAGKYWTAAVTITGDVYMWDSKKAKDEPPAPTRLHGVKKATSVSVGETHLLLVSSLHHPGYPPSTACSTEELKVKDESHELCENFMFDDLEFEDVFPNVQKDSVKKGLTDHRNFSEKSGDIAIRNLDYILTLSAHSFVSTSLDVLVDLEKLLDIKSLEPWSHRRFPTPTATFPAILDCEEEDRASELLRTRDYGTKRSLSLKKDGAQRLDGFLNTYDDAKDDISKQIRALRKKLQQIELLEEKQSKGHFLDDQQIAKLQTRSALESSLAELGEPVKTVHSKDCSSVDEKGSKRGGVSRKQRRKNKHKASQKDEEASIVVDNSKSVVEKRFLGVEAPQDANEEKDGDSESAMLSQDSKEIPPSNEIAIRDHAKDKIATSASSKKKSRKGGLSMFLSGALDDIPKSTPTPVIAKSEGPAWGGAKISKGLASLRQIQDEQIKTNETKHTKQIEELSDSIIKGKVQFSLFVPSSPIPMVPQNAQVPTAEKETPPWAASGTPPSLSRPSLRNIQLQQGKQQNISHSPKTRTTGFSVMTGQGSPSENSGVNRWFKPETETPSTIRSIQIEEKAMKDLKRFYSSVKIVKNQS
ncbi:hypothetical protein F511_22188 [Dorcoceras hygrometricum]|uniref:RCC1-like domain-containing protein n=1 Tax=Dorcoceras hygrometricum TaxID=472368 RepID=A0A2Z7BPB3_9LAMI|nr:hypothetical protein F511_22188 [Dorcoceras hygrometricum]